MPMPKIDRYTMPKFLAAAALGTVAFNTACGAQTDRLGDAPEQPTATASTQSTPGEAGGQSATPETDPTVAPNIKLTPEQANRVGEIVRSNALNSFTRVRGDATEDMYNGFGQLMAEKVEDGRTTLAWIRFQNIPDGVEISTETVILSGKSRDSETKASQWSVFTTNSPEAAAATADRQLTFGEAKELLKDPNTAFQGGHIKWSGGDVIQVTKDPQNATAFAVETGDYGNTTYSGQYSGRLLGLTPASDQAAAEDALRALLNPNF